MAGFVGVVSPRNNIAINGGSNGGLLVGACLTQHPELFGAAVPEVGVLDMLRFHKFTIGWAWKSDFGDPDNPDQYRWLRAYSPLAQHRPGKQYPATLIIRATTTTGWSPATRSSSPLPCRRPRRTPLQRRYSYGSRPPPGTAGQAHLEGESPSGPTYWPSWTRCWGRPRHNRSSRHHRAPPTPRTFLI